MEIDDVGDFEFLASSKLNQSHIKKLQISQNEIEISSNYEKVLEQFKLIFKQRKSVLEQYDQTRRQPKQRQPVSIIPKSSPYFVKPELKEFNGLYILAKIGYQYFVVEKRKSIDPLKELLSIKLAGHVKTIQAAAFFLNSTPHHSAGLSKNTKVEGCQCQFKYLINESEKYWFDINLDDQSESDINELRTAFAKLLRDIGYRPEKAIHGEFLSLPNKFKIKKGVKPLNIMKVFGV